jgi:signal transduction histidine kinase
MNASSIEPGLLRVFRAFVGIRLLLIMITIPLQAILPRQRISLYLILILIEAAGLLIYLSWPWLQDKLGKAYLPIGLIYASASSIAESALTMLLRGAGLIPGDPATRGFIGLLVLLLIPLILVSWQYRLRHVIFFILGTSLFELLLTVPIARFADIRIGFLLGLLLIRDLVFLLTGSIINRLVQESREQRMALATANTELAEHAATIERLAISQERNRLARELHDTLAHTLSGLAVQLEAIHSTWSGDPEAAHMMLRRSLTLTREGLRESRRAIQALRPSPLEELGFLPALRRLATDAADRRGLRLEVRLPERALNLEARVEQALYRIAEEAISNTLRHAEARTLNLRLEKRDGQLEMEIVDDGIGFDVHAVGDSDRYGLRGMQERSLSVDAKLELSSAPDGGTRIHLILGGLDDQSADLR